MTGSALKRWTLWSRKKSEIGKGSGEGGAKNRTGPEGGGFFSEVFLCFFVERVFGGGPVGVFFFFVWFLGSLGGLLLEVFLKSMRFSRKGW